MNTAAAIGATFVELLRKELTPEQFEQVRERNRTIRPGCCASHDFCDANMVMADAFRHHNVEPDIDDEYCCKLWGEAWNAAMPALTKGS